MDEHPTAMDSAAKGHRSGDTLFALSSGMPPAGVAVIRVSGPATAGVVAAVAGADVPARRATLRTIRDPRSGEAIDRGIVLRFEAPASYTGEDAAEFHLHGGRAVVAAMLDALGAMPGLRHAEAGEFTRRAFERGRLDLTAVEGLADLIASETEQQRRQALRIADGAFARRAEAWRDGIIRARAAIEADLDFADEEDVPGSVADRAVAGAAALAVDIAGVLADEGRGELIREGLDVAIMGPPNAGKSSLLNALARRDAAIVTSVPGTTRDIVEVRLDLGGAAVVLADTAGLREVAEEVEQEGIRRARERGRGADLVLWLSETGEPPPVLGRASGETHVAEIAAIRTKADLDDEGVEVRLSDSGFPMAISVRSGLGLAALEAALAERAGAAAGGEPPLVTRARHRRILAEVVEALAEVTPDARPEIAAEALRRASDGLGRLTGRIDVEDVLGSIFSSFCIGK